MKHNIVRVVPFSRNKSAGTRRYFVVLDTFGSGMQYTHDRRLELSYVVVREFGEEIGATMGQQFIEVRDAQDELDAMNQAVRFLEEL